MGDGMVRKPILLEVIAPILERVGLCFTCQVVLSGAGLDRGQDAYPEQWRSDFEATLGVVRRLSQIAGNGLVIRWSDPRSLRGLFLSLRYRVRRYPTFILGAREKFVGLEQAEAGLIPRLEALMGLRGNHVSQDSVAH
jgi:hypothetical protein